MIKFRIGSSLVFDISQKYKSLKIIDFDEAVSLISSNPDLEIVMSLRAPKETYNSGLEVILLNGNVGIVKPEIATEFATVNRTQLTTILSKHFKKQIIGWEHSLPAYDNGDAHLSHWLYLPILLLAGGYNVTLVPLSSWSDYLIQDYPRCKTLLEDAKMNSLNCGRKKLRDDVTVAALSNIILTPQKDSNSLYTWEKWMEPEVHLFDMLNKYIDNPKKSYLAYALNRLASEEIYWNTKNFHIKSSAFNMQYIIARFGLIKNNGMTDSIVMRMNELLNK